VLARGALRGPPPAPAYPSGPG